MCWVRTFNTSLSSHAIPASPFFCSAIKDPQILELSGIGRPDILSKIGVDVKLELPGVGENVQDHIIIPMTFELDPKTSHETLDAMANPDNVQKVMKL